MFVRTRQFGRKAAATDSVAETALRSLMRNLDCSVGISILEARLTENIQAVHAQLIAQIAAG